MEVCVILVVVAIIAGALAHFMDDKSVATVVAIIGALGALAVALWRGRGSEVDRTVEGPEAPT